MNELISVRLGLQQRVLPAYRAPFFDLLAGACAGGLCVFAGQPRDEEALGTPGELHAAKRFHGENVYLGSGRLYACHQRGLITWLEGWRPDVLVVEANPRYLSTPTAVKWMRAQGLPVVGWGLGVPPSGGFWRGLLRERFLSQFDALITYSQERSSTSAPDSFPSRFLSPPTLRRRGPPNPPPNARRVFPPARWCCLWDGYSRASGWMCSSVLARDCRRACAPA
jgi:hypothetical protein